MAAYRIGKRESASAPAISQPAGLLAKAVGVSFGSNSTGVNEATCPSMSAVLPMPTVNSMHWCLQRMPHAQYSIGKSEDVRLRE